MNKRIYAIGACMLVCALAASFIGKLYQSTNALALADEKISNTLASQTDEQLEVKTVYLTFDDGPSDTVTPQILSVLKEANVHATFFIIGRQAERRRYLIEQEITEGHTVAVHSYSHDYHEIYASPSALISDIDKCNGVLKSITGKSSTLYRFPGGSYGLSESLIKAATTHGMRYIDWNASTRDAELWNPTAWQLYQSAISTSADSSHIVLLCHDSPTKATTAQALPLIIDYYKQHGYTFAAF